MLGVFIGGLVKKGRGRWVRVVGGWCVLCCDGSMGWRNDGWSRRRREEGCG